MKDQIHNPPVSHRAFYSLVQYCPDLARLEAANVGVVLFCTEPSYLGVKLSKNHKRISQMFGRGHRDLKRLAAFESGLEDKLTSGRSDLYSLEQLNQLASMQVNTLRMTQFSPCRISDRPAEGLNQLYQDLVEPKSPQEFLAPQESLTRTLEARFAAPEIDVRIRRKVKVRIPFLGREEEIPYAYQNGRLNLIAPVTFPKSQSVLEERAAKYALQGESVYESTDPQLGQMQMLVVGQFETTTFDGQGTVRRILEDHRVRLFTREDLPALIDEIRIHGHVISA